ncbi:MAG: alpha-ketoglutarate-dependent dioxygenase AlkB [Myxococcota bacterium]
MQPRGRPRGTRLSRGFVSPAERARALEWLGTLHPLWEHRFSTVRPVPTGETQRMLHRPVYWFGNWQFACLGYYTPPHGVAQRCVRAEPFPELLQGWAARIEAQVRDTFPAAFVPERWRLNTCLVNFYGSRVDPDGRRHDQARVGAHRDFEPGPVGSISLGERALFQFTTRAGEVVEQLWLEDRSLIVFAGPHHKDKWFHRVQRVARDGGHELPPPIPGFSTRRVNFTFRYVPDEVVVDLAELGPTPRADVAELVDELARSSPYWSGARGG